ncbi:MAG: UDP-N-acetylmuramate--L-alanine ligase [Candidatus Cloacimonadota bacterium]|nr:UDP-N-acetylmuramate--L-alanine ligase [Candidatus Cloacimonadota bacterium]
MLGKTEKLHFVGIGGVGMSGIAELLVNQGFVITGSDIRESETVKHLQSLGIKIHIGHKEENVEDVDVVVKSSAVNNTNPEISAAYSKKIPVIRRAEMLSELMRMSYGIGIAGTHGKTTTTSMVGLMLKDADLDPTIIVGGKVKNYSSNNILGSGKYIVVEADEFDRSFLTLSPIIAGITNIEADHLDCYKDLDKIKEAFIEFANKVPFFGYVILCLDDRGVQSIIPKIDKKIFTYGLSNQADVRATNINQNNFHSKFNVNYLGENLGEIEMDIIGIHNINNALLAITTGLSLDIPFKKIQSGLRKYKGVFRRFEYKGSYNFIRIFDDYAHHPTEIKATLKGIRDNVSEKLIVVFQPHLYSRTRDFYELFGRSFFGADKLIITPIYPARESPIKGVTGNLIADAAIQSGHKDVTYIDKNEDIIANIQDIAVPGDIILTMGAGDIYKYTERMLENYEKK